jgi:hypothetical protein
LDRTHAPSAFESVSLPLNVLAAGTHSLTLGIHTTNASSGIFSASFDDVSISTEAVVPEPSALAFLLSCGSAICFMRRRDELR